MENKNGTDLIAVEIEVDFKNNEFQVTNTCTDMQVNVPPMTLHKQGFKYFSEFCSFFIKSVQAPKNASVLFTKSATTNLNSILEFNRMVL